MDIKNGSTVHINVYIHYIYAHTVLEIIDCAGILHPGQFKLVQNQYHGRL